MKEKFEKTLQGLRQEKLHNKLMPKHTILSEEQFAGWGDVPEEEQKRLKKYHDDYREDMRKRPAGEHDTFVNWMKFKYGVDAASGILMAIGGLASSGVGWASGVVASAGGHLAVAGLFSPAGIIAELGVAAGVGTIAGGVAAAAAFGTVVGLTINWAISGTSLKSSRERIRRAKKEPKYAKHMMDMFCQGRGFFCGKNAPDGWQIKCANKMGGLEQEADEGFFTASAKAKQKYTDPVGYRDFVQVENSFSKEDVLEIIAYMAILYKEDKKNGRLKFVEKREKNKKVIRVEFQRGSLLKQYENCYKAIEPHATTALTGRHYKSYKLFNQAFSLPIAEKKKFSARKKGQRVAAAAAGLGAVKEKQEENIEGEVQTALIDFFGPELEKKLGNEYTFGKWSHRSDDALEEFARMFQNASDFPRKFKKLPKFIRKMASVDRPMEDEPTAVAESNMNLQQKRLLEMNKRLMKL